MVSGLLWCRVGRAEMSGEGGMVKGVLVSKGFAG